ncbi:MAG: hypothetical protein ACREX4_18695 [Gammaproteobacteria bacterium]
MNARFSIIVVVVFVLAVVWQGAVPYRLAGEQFQLDPKSYQALLKPSVAVVPYGTYAEF